MIWTTLLGAAAAIASIVSFVPQAWKVIRSRRTADISTAMYAITVAAFALWGLYGLLLEQWPLVASNGLCFLLAAFILMMKLLPKAGKERVADTISPKR